MNTELNEVISAVGPDFHGLSYRERLIVGAVLKRLSSPPADDVRERAEEVAAKVYPDPYQSHMKHAYADAFERGYLEAQVRPCGTVTDTEVERSCEIMHDAYEAAAASEGWGTQEASRKPWVDVPEANKRTMRYAVRTLLEARP